jgi:hypothetical protein
MKCCFCQEWWYYAHDPSTQEVKAGDHLEDYEFEASLGYIA